ncbi:DUF4184 family protein [Mucilaginibacter flavus]|uniref:DUF4184 family protein n=1 Tax=Mucilaginibacter flavus TaxID=931504 RepID=UPI0025B5DADF|nr:DUF4184 family protein [Mucilaginibacter flavus]MDN3581377.1 DUF4184 family protein [Mucilaginibacter flavus]
MSELSKRWFSLTGLIIGSITPDFEYFIRMRVKSVYSHTLPGLFWFDVPLGILLTFVYLAFIRDGLIAHLPSRFNRRFSKYGGIPVKKTLAYTAPIVLSVLIGAASHLLWDAFTHPHGYFVQLMPILSIGVHAGGHYIYVYKLLQHGSTLVGLAFIAYLVYKLPKEKQTKVVHIRWYWVTILIIVVLTIIARFLGGVTLKAYGNLIVTGISGFLIGLIISSFFILVAQKGQKTMS